MRHPRGLTIVELMFAMAILAIALLSLVLTTSVALRHTQKSREMLAAENAARTQMEVILATDFEDIFATYKSATFSVPLTYGGANVATGTYEFPTVVDGTEGTVLSETAAATMLGGTPIDMNRNGVTGETLTAAADPYTFVPMRIVVEWNTTMGPARYEMMVILNDRDGE